MSTEQDELIQRLHSATAKMPWHEMQRSFAQGRTLYVAGELDLIAVATALVNDDSAYMEPLIEAETVRAVSDDEAQVWHEEDKSVWAVVVPPYVLIQPVEED